MINKLNEQLGKLLGWYTVEAWKCNKCYQGNRYVWGRAHWHFPTHYAVNLPSFTTNLEAVQEAIDILIADGWTVDSHQFPKSENHPSGFSLVEIYRPKPSKTGRGNDDHFIWNNCFIEEAEGKDSLAKALTMAAIRVFTFKEVQALRKRADELEVEAYVEPTG